MSSLDLNNINVLNYNQNEIYVETNNNRYKFVASKDGVRPSFLSMSINEVKAINSNTNAFELGMLTFEDEYKEELYRELHIHNWEDIITNEQIYDIIKNPTIEGLEKLLAIDNSTNFERVRATKLRLLDEGFDISTNVRTIIDRRFKELQDRQRVTTISLGEKDVAPTASSKEVQELSEQNAALQAQLDEMRKMLELITKNQAPVMTETVNEEVEAKPSTTAKRGRPPKKN